MELTEVEKANLNFFGNYANMNMQIEELKIYLNEVHNFIKNTHIKLQSSKIKNQNQDTLETLKYHFEYTQGEILQKSIIISIIILLESEIDIYCTDFKRYKKLTIGYNDFKGNLLEKFKMFFSKMLLSNFNFQGKIWQDVIGLYEVRNSLVHNSGFICNFNQRKTIENFVARNKSFEINDDERICISLQACNEGITIIESFFKEITDYALKTFEGHYSPK